MSTQPPRRCATPASTRASRDVEAAITIVDFRGAYQRFAGSSVGGIARGGERFA